ncbi:MAG: DUF952 domain-containing protein [Pseudomonadota bacterium]
MLILKICSAEEWREAEQKGRFDGSEVDLVDGFIHFSTVEQAPETARLYFAERDDLVVVAVDPDRIGDDLKWEPSRGGALFPHLYAPLSLESVAWVRPLPLAPDGQHEFPS